MSTKEMKMGSALLISSPIHREFNCNIRDNLSSNKAELMALILSLIVCPKAAHITIYTDSQWVINNFNDLSNLTILEIDKSKANYKIWWLLLFKMVRIYDLNIKLVKIKAHGDNNNNKKVDKLAKLGTDKETLIIEDVLLLHNGTICWREIPVERNLILMIKGIKDAQFIDEFLSLNRNAIY